MIKSPPRPPAEAPAAVGIVVRDAPPRGTASPAVRFVWGAGVAAAPSLPFGRWKPAAGAR
jgi:hypothetical protein